MMPLLILRLTAKSKLVIMLNIDLYRFDEIRISLYDIFKTYGGETRSEAPECTLYYDFDPYNSKEPILLALMVKDGDT
jgi:hypothetical protein